MHRNRPVFWIVTSVVVGLLLCCGGPYWFFTGDWPVARLDMGNGVTVWISHPLWWEMSVGFQYSVSGRKLATAEGTFAILDPETASLARFEVVRSRKGSIAAIVETHRPRQVLILVDTRNGRQGSVWDPVDGEDLPFPQLLREFCEQMDDDGFLEGDPHFELPLKSNEHGVLPHTECRECQGFSIVLTEAEPAGEDHLDSRVAACVGQRSGQYLKVSPGRVLWV